MSDTTILDILPNWVVQFLRKIPHHHIPEIWKKPFILPSPSSLAGTTCYDRKGNWKNPPRINPKISQKTHTINFTTSTISSSGVNLCIRCIHPVQKKMRSRMYLVTHVVSLTQKKTGFEGAEKNLLTIVAVLQYKCWKILGEVIWGISPAPSDHNLTESQEGCRCLTPQYIQRRPPKPVSFLNEHRLTKFPRSMLMVYQNWVQACIRLHKI